MSQMQFHNACLQVRNAQRQVFDVTEYIHGDWRLTQIRFIHVQQSATINTMLYRQQFGVTAESHVAQPCGNVVRRPIGDGDVGTNMAIRL